MLKNSGRTRKRKNQQQKVWFLLKKVWKRSNFCQKMGRILVWFWKHWIWPWKGQINDKRSDFCQKRGIILVWFWKHWIWPWKRQINTIRSDFYIKRSEKSLTFIKKGVKFGSDFEKFGSDQEKDKKRHKVWFLLEKVWKRSDFHQKRGLIWVRLWKI